MAGSSKPSELAVPLSVHGSADATEILRGWIVDQGLHVSLIRGFDDPAAWGVLLTDVARHVARVFETENVCSQDEALNKIKAMLDAEWDSPTDPGETAAIQ